MSKIAIITDSNSGVTQEQAKELGIFVVPMPFRINDEDFYEDINLTQEQFYQKLAEDASVSTSQPSPDSLMTLWDKVLADHDQIIYIPMSSGLSGSCQSAMMIANEEMKEKSLLLIIREFPLLRGSQFLMPRKWQMPVKVLRKSLNI